MLAVGSDGAAKSSQLLSALDPHSQQVIPNLPNKPPSDDPFGQAVFSNESGQHDTRLVMPNGTVYTGNRMNGVSSPATGCAVDSLISIVLFSHVKNLLEP
jgi:hypothetical protein